MEKLLYIFAGVMIGALCVAVLGAATTRMRAHHDDRDVTASYDPNDAVYKFIPEAPKDWRDMFGASERTRLLHSISELRVVVAAQGKRIIALEKRLDPNESMK